MKDFTSLAFSDMPPGRRFVIGLVPGHDQKDRGRTIDHPEIVVMRPEVQDGRPKDLLVVGGNIAGMGRVLHDPTHFSALVGEQLVLTWGLIQGGERHLCATVASIRVSRPFGLHDSSAFFARQRWSLAVPEPPPVGTRPKLTIVKRGH